LGTSPNDNSLQQDRDDVEISGLTVDGNYAGVASRIHVSATSIEGIKVFGSRTLIQNVDVVNLAAERAEVSHSYEEIFGIYAGSAAKDSVVTIDGCQVYNFQNWNDYGGILAINVVGYGANNPSGYVTGNYVALGNHIAEYGFGTASPGNLHFIGNYCIGANRSFNHDTEGSEVDTLEIAYNEFYATGLAHGIFMYKNGNFNIHHNYIKLYVPGSVGIQFFGPDESYSPESIYVSNNTIVNVAVGGLPCWGIVGNDQVSYFSFVGNRIQGSLNSVVQWPSKPGHYYFDNRQIGSALTALGFPN
jgi:hypothetical protein